MIIIRAYCACVIHAQLKIKYTVCGPWSATKYYYLEYLI